MLSKIWKVPIHHNFISNLNYNQIILYSDLIIEDEKNKFNETREYIEYLASFIDAKAVSEVKKKRGGENDHSVSKDEFEKQIKEKSFMSEEIFDIGRDIKNTNLYNNSSGDKNKEKRLSSRAMSRILED
mgnify:CR=1 FL=1|tara:strand:+ start:1480 stop:1866 length:387 start_codon:yes stop_codon:yes gene_type:complete